MVNQIKTLSTKTNKEFKMKYWIDRIKAKQNSSFPLLGGRNCTHKNNKMKYWWHLVGASSKYNSKNCSGLLPHYNQCLASYL